MINMKYLSRLFFPIFCNKYILEGCHVSSALQNMWLGLDVICASGIISYMDKPLNK